MESGCSISRFGTILGGSNMKISKERLAVEAEATGFRVEVLEKVIHQLNLLDGFRNHPLLKKQLVLKGGTARTRSVQLIALSSKLKGSTKEGRRQINISKYP